MIKHFRIAMVAMVLAISGANLAQAAGDSKGVKETTREIAPGVYSFAPGDNYHSMFIVTDEGVAAFETVNSKHATGLLEAIRKVTDKPIKYAFHSHNHWDHVNGGKVMQDAGAQTVMHKRAAEWLAANPSRDSSKANIAWEGKRRDIKLGDVTIQLHYLGMNHGLGMTVFVIPERKVGYIADLVTPNRVMFSIVPDFNIGEWERSLKEIQALDFDIAVCSHNDLPHDKALNGCTKQHVIEEGAFIKDLRNAIMAEMKKGTPAMDIPSVVKVPKYAHWNHYDEWLPLNATRLLLDMWMGPYPWTVE